MFRSSMCMMRGFLANTQLLGATGVIKAWQPGRAFGFVVDDESQKSYFVHYQDCQFADGVENKSIAEGARVEFQVEMDRRRRDGSMRAAKVTQPGGAPLPAGPHGRAPRASEEGVDPNADKGELVGKRDVKGKVRSIAGSFGFIQFQDPNMIKYGTIFFHASSVMPGVTLRIGEAVVFDIEADTRSPNPTGEKKIRAINVAKLL